MPVFNTQGLPVQLVVQPDRNFSSLAAGLQPGQVLQGRVSEVLADGKAIVNFRGVAVTAELKGVALARGEVISVSVQNLQGQPVLRLLPQTPAAVAPQAVANVQQSAPIDSEVAAVLAQLNLPRDNFHAAVVQLLQGYSVPPSRESVAAVKELLASLPAFLEQPVPAPAAAPVLAPAVPPGPVGTVPAVQTAPVIQSAPAVARPLAATAPVAEPPLPQPAVNTALSRGYNLGRLLAALDGGRLSTPPAAPASTAMPASALSPTAPAVQSGIPASSVLAQPGVPVSSSPPRSASPKAGETPSALRGETSPEVSADATAVARVLADAASSNAPQPLPAIIESAIRAMESTIQGNTELSANVQQALTDLARDLAALVQTGNNQPVSELGAAAGRLNGIIRSLPGGNTALPAQPAPAAGGAPVPAGPATAASGPVPVPVRSAAELAGALAGIIHEEVAQAVQPQVTIVASAVVPVPASAGTGRAPVQPVRAGNPAPVRDSEIGGARTETPRSAMPAPVSLPSAVLEADAPVDVPRLMAVIAQTAPAISIPADVPEPVQAGNTAIQPAPVAPTPAQVQVLSGAVVTVASRAETLSSALLSAAGEPPALPQPVAPPVPDPRVGFIPPLSARNAAGSYGATSAGGPRLPAAEPAQAAFVPVPAPRADAAGNIRAPQAAPSPTPVQAGPVQMGRDVVETAVFMHAFNLPPAREVARAAHEYLFGQAHLTESLQQFEDVAASAGTRTLPAPVREAVQTALQVVRDVRVTMEGDEMSASKLQGAVEKLGLSHEAKLARAAGQDGEPRPTQQVVAQAVHGAQDSLKAAITGLRDRAESALALAQSAPAREALGALRTSADDILQVVQSQQVGSVSRSSATQVMYVQLPIAVGNEMRGGEVHLSWKKDGEGGKNRRRDPRAPATMNLNMETRALGPVRVRMQMTGQNLSLVFQVNDPAIQSYLSGEFPGLKDRLSGFSLRVDRCVAEVARDEAGDDAPRAVAPTSTVDFRA